MPVFGASRAQAERTRSRPSAVWQASAGHRLKEEGGEDLDRVEELAADDLDAHDPPAAQRAQLLHQRGLVDAEIELAPIGGLGELGRTVEATDPGPAAADVGLDEDRPAQALGGEQRLAGVVDDAGARITEAEVVEEAELVGLGDLVAVDGAAVDDGDLAPLPVPQLRGCNAWSGLARAGRRRDLRG
ncbi:hypothetical protein OV079_18265 [Nannocystis pusilla]|uniref:Uncharacterized protein n=1 Tax=Nannocystis pusilla TaxID=889268 RepID=A0A9X3ENN5_9BACT|nr:hypothetical protein [Nannocystis pusilla]MCY1007459.1 hypothetical protein [Nannocystis pusilla]